MSARLSSALVDASMIIPLSGNQSTKENGAMADHCMLFRRPHGQQAPSASHQATDTHLHAIPARWDSTGAEEEGHLQVLRGARGLD